MTTKHLHRTALAPITPSDEEYSVMKALVLDQIDNRTVATVKDIDLPALAEGDVRVAIDWSSLTIKTPRRSPAKAKLSVSFRWCRALILPVR